MACETSDGLIPPEVEIGENEGFGEKDIFGRKELGESLVRIIEQVEHPLVIALDAPWGSGKTTFVKMWAGHLRNNGFPVIYFDAFKHDYMQDAFTAIAGEVAAAAQKAKATDADTYKTYVHKATEAGKILFRSGGRIAIRLGSLGLLDADAIDGISEDVAKAISEETKKEATEVWNDYMRERIEKSNEERLTFEAFMESLTALAQELSSHAEIQGAEESEATAAIEARRPLVFIVDELDRCRPNFALELLERIKHLFSTVGVVFVLVTHLKQMESCASFVYGENIDARTYLEKFFHITALFSDEQRMEDNAVSRYLNYISRNWPNDDQSGQLSSYFIRQIGYFSSAKKLSLRTVERISSEFILFLLSTNKNHLRIFALLPSLFLIKVVHPSIYDLARRGSLTFEEIIKS